jgi:predicted RND superfamily exporter protein
MAVGFGSVVLALAAATVSTGVGFFSNVVSPLPAIRDFAVLSSGGILATFVAFGVFLPALKIEVDSTLEGRLGWDRNKGAFGVGSGRANVVLERLGSLSTRAPVAIVIVSLLLASAGSLGATTIDTEFNQADFLPQDAPDWAGILPGPLEPDTYTIADDFAYLSNGFQLRGDDSRSQVLIRGNVTDAATLRAVDDATGNVSAGSSIQRRPDGSGALEGPHTAIRAVAADNETFAAFVDERDADGDGLPEEDVAAVYEMLFAADEVAAANVLSRSEAGEISSARLLVSVRSAESVQTIAGDTRTFADGIEGDVDGITATATGPPVTDAVIQDALLETLIEAFVVTLVVILAFLTALFRVRYGSWSLGAVVLAPVVASLAWLLGTMSLLDIPFNSETAVITSLAIGLGVDYSIHAGERFMEERERRDGLEAAIRRTITGTGGTLLASAATTAAAFGVLALALSPPLRRFGTVTGLAIIFAFVAVVTMLPGLLVVRDRLTTTGG